MYMYEVYLSCIVSHISADDCKYFRFRLYTTKHQIQIVCDHKDFWQLPSLHSSAGGLEIFVTAVAWGLKSLAVVRGEVDPPLILIVLLV